MAFIAVLVLVLSAGLGFAQEPGDGQQAAEGEVGPRGHDEIVLEVAEEVPGFAGYFINEGDLVIWLLPDTPAERAEHAQRLLAERFGDPSFERRQIATREARYSWQELYAWHPRVWETSVEVVSSTIHQGINRLQVGIRYPWDRWRFLSQVKQRGVPRDAVEVRWEQMPEAGLGLPEGGGLALAALVGLVAVGTGALWSWRRLH